MEKPPLTSHIDSNLFFSLNVRIYFSNWSFILNVFFLLFPIQICEYLLICSLLLSSQPMELKMLSELNLPFLSTSHSFHSIPYADPKEEEENKCIIMRRFRCNRNSCRVAVALLPMSNHFGKYQVKFDQGFFFSVSFFFASSFKPIFFHHILHSVCSTGEN